MLTKQRDSAMKALQDQHLSDVERERLEVELHNRDESLQEIRVDMKRVQEIAAKIDVQAIVNAVKIASSLW